MAKKHLADVKTKPESALNIVFLPFCLSTRWTNALKKTKKNKEKRIHNNESQMSTTVSLSGSAEIFITNGYV